MTEPARRGAACDAWLDAIPLGAVWRELPDDPAVFDPTSASDRLLLYRRLIGSGPSSGFLGASGERHIFWGYAAQLHWQCESGRLSAAPGADAIEAGSWWGAMNASLCLLPIRAATRAGILGAQEVAEEGDPLRPHESAFAGACEAWTDFFGATATVDDEEDWEAARVTGWRAHVRSIETGVRVFEPLFRVMAAPERQFGRGWTRMVDFFGKAALRTDLEAIARFRSSLPPRPLAAGEVPGAVSDFDEATNDATRRIVALATLPNWRFALRRLLWNRSMRDPVLRDESLDILFGERGSDPEIQRRFRRALLPGPLRS